MSEEEIIKVITYKLNMKNADVYAPILYEEIQNLLDLYNKEKEKTPESIRKQFEIYQNRICELEEAIKELKEKNKELENADLTLVYMNGFYDGEKKYKDKIKETIKEYEDFRKKYPVEFRKYKMRPIIVVLQEILKKGDK